MSDDKAPKKPYNKIVTTGMWLTLAVLVFWAGGEAFKKVEMYIPWALAVGVLILILGLLIQFRKPKVPSDSQKS